MVAAKVDSLFSPSYTPKAFASLLLSPYSSGLACASWHNWSYAGDEESNSAMGERSDERAEILTPIVTKPF